MSDQAPLVDLEERAEALLRVEAPSVVRKQIPPPSGDIHDYLSIAPYWWPNPDTEDGLPWVERDGHYNTRTLDIPDKSGLYLLLDLVWLLGTAFERSGRLAYADKAADCLRTWFLEPATRMNPNLNYAQGVPGVAQGRPAGLIETREMGRLLRGAQLIEGSPAWSVHDSGRLREWMSQFISWMRSSPLAIAERDAANNHATWYRAQAAAMLEFIGERSAAHDMVCSGREVIDRQILPDGSQPNELRRANSRHYCMFNLLGICRLAEVGDRVGAELWSYHSPRGASLHGALDRLVSDWNAWPVPTLEPMASDESEFTGVLHYAAAHYAGLFDERLRKAPCAAC